MELLLQNAGERGLSIKELVKMLGVSRKAVKRILYNADFVKRTNPLLHGSNKRKIRVFSYSVPCGVPFYKQFKNVKKVVASEEPDEPTGFLGGGLDVAIHVALNGPTKLVSENSTSSLKSVAEQRTVALKRELSTETDWTIV